MKTRMWMLSFLLVLSLLSTNALAETGNPYGNIVLNESSAVHVTNHTRINVSDTFYFQIHDGGTHETSIGRLKLFTTPYAVVNGLEVTDIENYLGSGYNELLYTDDSGHTRLKSSFYDSVKKEHLIFYEPGIDEIGYTYNVSLIDWTTTEFDPETNTTYDHTELAEDSTVDIALDQWGNAVVYINGAGTVVLPKPFATDANGVYYPLTWQLDKSNHVLRIGDLETLNDAVYPVTVDPTELVTNGGFETGTFSGWTTDGWAWQVTTGTTHSGTYKAQYVDSHIFTVTISQSVTLDTAQYATWWITKSGVVKYMRLYIDGVYKGEVSAGNPYPTYVNGNVSIPGYTGSHLLNLSYIGADTNSGFFLDDISVLADESVPVVGFTSNVTFGLAPLNVQFNDTSTGGPTSWYWDFGDGNTSTNRNPTHIYYTPGTYNVSLNASNAFGSSELIEVNYITVYNSVTAGFTATPTSGTAPMQVTFTDTSTGANSWKWLVDGVQVSTATNLIYTFTDQGVYDIQHYAYNTVSGVGDWENRTDHITVYSSSVSNCDFIANVTYGNVPLTVLFNDTSGGSPSSWSWSIDGVYQTDTQDMTVTFNEPGIYTIGHTADLYTETKTNYIQVYPANYGGIYGYIFDADTNEPISSVNCQLSNSSATATFLSDSEGYFYFWPVWNGVYDLTVSKSGYTTGTLPNTIINGTTLRQDIYLTQSGDIVQDENITNYSSDWLTFDLTTDEDTKTIILDYEVTQGGTSYANCTIYGDSGPVYSSNVSTQSGTFSFAGSAGNNYLVSFDIMNSEGNRYSGAFSVLFYRGFPSQNPVFPPDMPRGLINGILVFFAIVCMMMFGKAYIEIGMILGTAVLAASYIWGFLNLPETVQTPVIIFLSALVAGGEYIAKKKVLG